MKKKLFSLLAILLSVFALCSCGLYGDKEYTIVFETNGGNAIADVVLEWNDKIDYPVATKTGYTFTGWFSDPGCTVPYEAETLTENITLYAGWSVNYYNITFNANGGKFSEDREEIPKTYAFGTTFDVEKPIKEGYTFSGWYTTQDCKTSYGNKMKADFVTVYAKYMINQYTLSFEKGADNVSGEMDELTLSYNETITLNESLFSRPGYNFKGWATEEGGNVVYYNMGQYTQKASNTKLYAVWEAKNIEISYLSFGLEFASRNGTYGECVDLSLTPSKVGYTFKGWASSFTQTTDTSCDAKKMYYVLNGENYEVANISEFESGVTYYELIVSNQIVIGAKDLEVYAVFERNACSLTFNTNGASENITINTYTGLPIQAPSALSKEGNTFGGWYNNQSFAGDMVQFPVTLTTNVALYAKWSQNAYVIKFVSIYSEETMTDVNALYGETVQLPTNSFTRAGYTFKGWSLTDGNVVQYENGATVSNLSTGGVVTLYAIWQANGNTPYTVEYSFKTLEGTYVVNNSLTENLQGTTGAMTNAVYKEVTGFEAETETVEQVEIKGDGSTVVTLKYSRKNFTVSFKEGETTLLSVEMPYESEIGSYPQSLDKAGYSLALTIGGNAYSGEYQVVANTDVIAVYTANTYKISFTNVSTPIEDMTVTFGTFVELPYPLRAGYAFTGWKLDDKSIELREEDEKYEITVPSNISLKASWAAAGANYTVKYLFESINDSTLFEEDENIQAQESKTGITGKNTNVSYKEIPNFTASTTPITQLEIAADGSTVITLKYTRNSYKVTFVEEGHENIEVSVKYKGTISQAQADALKRNGYSLSMTASGQAFTTSTVVTSNVTVTLTYTANAYIISFFNANEEDINSSYGASETLPTPTKTGYSFGGWSLTDGGSKAYDGGQTITVENALNLYAIWNAENVNYTVKHLLQDLNDETQYAVVSTIQDSQVLQGLTGSLTNAQYLSIPHFTQSPDAITQKTIAGDGSTVIELKYTRDTYKVSYQEGGVEKAFKNIKYQGKTGVYPTSLNRTGYSLALTIGGESYSDTYQVIADTTVVLVYTANEYHISFTGTVNPIETMTVHFGDKVTLPEQAKRGYAFSWLLNDEAVTLTEGKYEVTQASDISLKASWVANSYKVKFVTDNANITYDDINATYDTEFTIPEVNSNPNIEHVFLYWTYTNGVIYEGATVKNLTNENNATITLTAVWSVNPRLISFYDASLSGTEWIQGNIVSIKTQYDDEAISVPSSPSKPGYNFVGWKNAENSEMFVNGITTVSGDATYVAVYEVATYKYEFSGYYLAADGEVQNTSQTLAYGAQVVSPAVVAKTGYVFVGWYSDAELTKSVIVDEVATKNMKYYAKYSQVEAAFSYLNKKNGSIVYSTNTAITSSNARDTFISEYVQDLYTKTLAYAYIDQVIANLIADQENTTAFTSILGYFGTVAGGAASVYAYGTGDPATDAYLNLATLKANLSFRQYVDNVLTPLVKKSKFDGNVLNSVERTITALDLAFAWAMTDEDENPTQKATLLAGMKLFLSNEIPSAYLEQVFDGSGNFTNDMIPSIVAAYATYIANGKDEVINVLKGNVVSMAGGGDDGNYAWENMYKANVTALVNLIDLTYQEFDYDIVDILYLAAALQSQEGFEKVLSFNYTQKSFYNSLYNTYLSNGYNPVREGYVFDGWTVEGNFAYPNWKKVYAEVDQVQIVGTGTITIKWHHDEATTFEVYMDGVKQTSTITGSDGYYQTTITGVPNDTDVTIKIVAVQAPSSAFSYTVFGTSENLTIASVDLSSKGTNEYKYKYYDVKHIDVTNKADWYYVADVTDGKMFYFYQQHDYNFGSNVTSLQISDSKFATINGATLSTALYLGTFDLTVNYNDSTTKVYKCTIMPLVEDIEFGSDIKSYIAEKEGNKANSEYLKQRLASADTDPYVIGVLSYSYMSGKYSDYSYVYKDNSGLSWPLYNGFSFKATAKVRANASGVKTLDHNSFKFAYTFYESSNNGETWTVNKNLAIYDEINDVFYFNKSADLTKIYKVVVSYNIDGSNIYVPEAYKLEADQQDMQKEFIFKLNNGVNVFTHKGFKTAFNDKTVECINVHSTIEAEMSLSSLIYIEDQVFIDSFATGGDITLTNGEIDLENITMLKKNSSNPDYQYGEYVWALSDSSDYDIKDSRGNYYKFVGKDSGEYVISDATIVENYKSGKFKISELNPGYSKYITSHYTAGVPYYRASSQLGSNSLDSGATVEYVADLVVNGNYFAIDGSKLPYYTNNQIVTAGDTMNASGYTVYSSSSGLITCRTNSEYTIKNLTVLSNNITYDEFKSQSSLSRDEIATIAEYMTRTSGCFNGIFVQSPFSTNDGGLDRYFGGEHEYYCYNKYNELELLKSKTKLVLDNVNVYNALIGAYTDTLADCEFSYVSIDNSWANSIYGYGTRSVSLTMCELGQSGGTAIELDDISVLIKGTCGLGTSPYGDSDYYNPILIVDEYTINHINNKISGGEQWFVAYSMSASAIGLKKILAGVSQNTIVYNDGGVEKMNLVIMEQNTAGLKNLRNNVGGESGLSYNEFDFMNLELTIKDSSGNPIFKQNVAKRHTDAYLFGKDAKPVASSGGADVYSNGTDTLYYVAGMADVYQMYYGFGLTASVGSMQIFAYVPVNPANIPQN